ncbi:MAG: TolC family protein [Planctomycetota bacterium]|nr:TolC family protein [Planctomycetota bacterium]
MSPAVNDRRLRAALRPGVFLVACGLICAAVAGCAHSEKRLSYFGTPDYEEEVNTELKIEEPDTVNIPSDAAVGTVTPRTIGDRTHDGVWDLTLSEAIQLALENNKVARTRNEFLSPGNPILQNGEGVASVYDPAIRESGVLFGTRGVEAALSSFDPVFNSSISMGNSEAIQNNPITSGGIQAGRTLTQQTSQFAAGFTKNMAYGAQVGVTQNWNYTESNQLLQLFPSVFTGNLQFSYQQPLWAGAGTEFTRIAGPVNPNVQAIAGVNQGVVIARINTDISLADFEFQVRNMVFDVETLYWDLYQAYRNYDSLAQARDAALSTWRSVSAKSKSGLIGGGRSEEAQAREQYYEARSRAETALGGPAGRGGESGIYGLELQLRRICGLPSNDGRIIRPIDEPGMSPIEHDWHTCLATAFARRSELRKQRWTIKSVELQLKAAKSVANPQLNLVSSYQLNGFGNNLFGPNGPPGSDGAQLQSAYRTQFQGDQTAWNVGLQFSAPLGLRSALSQVRNQELRVIKAQAVLAAQELEVSHELAGAFQAIDYWYQNAETNYNRREAAMENLEAVQADYDLDRKSLDLLLQAQNRLAIAEVAFYRSVTEYSKALCELQFRKGTLLEYNNVYLAEGAWSTEAQRDVMRKEWARSFSFDAPRLDPVHDEPEPFAREVGYEAGVSIGVEPFGPARERSPANVPLPPVPTTRLSQPIDTNEDFEEWEAPAAGND